jgi:hypothetical protein
LRLAVDLQRLVGDPRRTASAELDLAEVYYWCGEIDEAIATVKLALGQFRKTASRLELAIGLNNLGIYFTSCGRAIEAAPVAREALQIGRESRSVRVIALAAQTCATIAALAGREGQVCAQLFGYVARRYATVGLVEVGATEVNAHDRLRTLVTGMLPSSDMADSVREGERFDDEAAIAAALRCIDV